jgi:hypothetical protein
MLGAAQDASLEELRRDQLYLYNLLGDPALQLRRPIPAPAFEPARSQSGVLIARVEIPTPARVTLSLETRRQALPHALEPVPPGEAGFEAIRRNHARANDKTLWTQSYELASSPAMIAMPDVPALEPGSYWLKLFAVVGGVAYADAQPIVVASDASESTTK